MSQFEQTSQPERSEDGLQARNASPVELQLLGGDGSMLLDSINAFMRVQEDGLDTLTEFPEEPYERELTEKQSRGSNMQEKIALSPIPAADESPFEPLFLPFEAYPQQSEASVKEKAILAVNDA